jgi:hypothetical protein
MFSVPVQIVASDRLCHCFSVPVETLTVGRLITLTIWQYIATYAGFHPISALEPNHNNQSIASMRILHHKASWDTMTAKLIPYPANQKYPRHSCICDKKACPVLTKAFQGLGDVRGNFLQVPKVNSKSKCKPTTKKKEEEFERIMQILQLPHKSFETKKYLALHHYNPTIIMLWDGRIPGDHGVKVEDLERLGLCGLGREYLGVDQTEQDKQTGKCRILPTYCLGAAQADCNEMRATNGSNVLHSMPVLQAPFNNMHVHQHYWSATSQGNLCGQKHMKLNELHEITVVKEELKKAKEAADHQKEEALNRLEELRHENAAVKEELKTAKKAADHRKEEALNRLEELRHENAAVKEELKKAKEAADHQKKEALNRLEELRNENTAVKEKLKTAKEAADHRKEEALNRVDELRHENAAVNEELKAAKAAADHQKEEALNRWIALRDENAAVKEELTAAKEAANHQKDTNERELQVHAEDTARLRQELIQAVKKLNKEEQQLSILRVRYHEKEQKRKLAWEQQFMLEHPRPRMAVEEYWLQLPPHHPLAVITERNSQAQEDQAWTKETKYFEETEVNKLTLIQLRSLFCTGSDRRQRAQEMPGTYSHQLAGRFFLAIHPPNQDLVAMSAAHFRLGQNAFHPDKARGNRAMEYMRQRLVAYMQPVNHRDESPFSATNQLAQELSAAVTHLEEEFIPENEWSKKCDEYVETKMASNELPVEVVDLCHDDDESEDDGMECNDDESI